MKKFATLALVSTAMFLGACSNGESETPVVSPSAEVEASADTSATPSESTITIDLASPTASATASADLSSPSASAEASAETSPATETAEWRDITKSEAEELVKKYLEDNNEYIPSMIVAADQGNGEYLVQCYDNLGDHNSTSGWYIVNKSTGEIRNALE